jgi:hypothetical protein
LTWFGVKKRKKEKTWPDLPLDGPCSRAHAMHAYAFPHPPTVDDRGPWVPFSTAPTHSTAVPNSAYKSLTDVKPKNNLKITSQK